MRKWMLVLSLLAVLVGVLSLLPLSTRQLEAQSTATCGPNVVYVVNRGDTLFRIARRFGTTIAALQAANAIPNINRIYVGQRLVIACPTTNPPVVVPPLIPTPVVPQPIVVQPPTLLQTGFCGGFRAVSPDSGLLLGNNTFYWEPAPGATAYRVNIYSVDAGGALRVSYTTFAPNTSLIGDVNYGPAGPGFRFAWDVEALFGEQVICRSNRLTMFRASQPPTPTPEPTSSAPTPAV
ncbi:MAG: LysM peptidoglycan-binding domain-containing protein [Candidatus Flexifilum sp.]|jgi:LysM repeat protein